MTAMLDTLMDISEAEVGAMRLAREPLELAEVVKDAVALYSDVAEDTHVELQSGCAPGVCVSADRNRMRQVAANLLDNAIKYTPPGGRVEVRTARDGAEALLTVTDTGAGIPAGELPRIWERLYRGDASRSERGLGLGLSLVKAIVEPGGRVRRPRPGRGRPSWSACRLLIPLTRRCHARSAWYSPISYSLKAGVISARRTYQMQWQVRDRAARRPTAVHRNLMVGALIAARPRRAAWPRAMPPLRSCSPLPPPPHRRRIRKAATPTSWPRWPRRW